MDELSEDEIQAEVISKISDIVNMIEPGSMVTKHLLIVETLDGEGEEGLHTLYTPHMKKWDLLGMVEMVKHVETARMTAHEVMRHMGH